MGIVGYCRVLVAEELKMKRNCTLVVPPNGILITKQFTGYLNQ